MNTISKRLLSALLVLAMVLSISPVITLPAAAEGTEDTRSHPVSEIVAAQSGSVYCEHCKKDVSWDDWTSVETKLSSSASYYIETSSSGHFYVEKDLSGSYSMLFYIKASTPENPFCLHLNGFNLTNTNGSALGAWGYFAVMGEGIVTGLSKASGQGGAIHSNRGNSTPTVDLYGGTYRSSHSSNFVVGSLGKGINLNIHTDDVVIDGNIAMRLDYTHYSDTYPNRVVSCNMNIEGGTINGKIALGVKTGMDTDEPENKDTDTTNDMLIKEMASLNISGGTFTDTTGLFTYNPGFTSGTTVDADGFKDRVSITGGTFSSDPSTFVSTHYAAVQDGNVWKVKLTHVYGDDKICDICGAVEPDWPAFELNAEGYAYCEACYKQAIAAGKTKDEALEASWKQWEVCDESISDADGNMIGSGYSGHYYLNAPLTVTKKRLARVYNAADVCLNLNGYNITKAADAAAGPIFSTGKDTGRSAPTLNIMDSVGTSIVTGGGAVGNYIGAALHVSNGTCNVYGGTFRRTATAASYRTVTVQDGGILNLYGGTIDGRLYDTTDVTKLAEDQTASRSGMAVYMEGSSADTKATFNMYDGEIYGGTLKASASAKGSAAVQVGWSSSTRPYGYAEFNMFDGTIHGGSNNETSSDVTYLSSGSVSVHASAVMNMSGGTISGGWSAKNAGNLLVAGTLNMSGDAQIYGTAYDPDAETPQYDCENAGGLVYVAGGGIVNMSDNAQLHDGAALSQAGNLFLAANSQLNMSGNAKIYGGVAGSRGGNIRAYTTDASTDRPVMTMSGNATVYGGHAMSASNHEDNVWFGNGDLIMKDNAIIRGSHSETALTGVLKSAVSMTSGSRLILDGNATIANEIGNSNNLVYVDTLIVTKSWTGTAHICASMVTNSVVGGYCGTFDYETLEGTKDATAAGTYTGKLYCVGVPTVGINGDLIVPTASVITQSGENYYLSLADALTAYAGANKAYIKVHSATTIELSGDTYVDANGKALQITGTGKLYAMDSSNDDHDGYGTWTVAEEVDVVRDVTNPVNGKRYINMTHNVSAGTETIFSFNLDMKLSAVTLRASKNENMGLYYKADISLDDAFAERIVTHGVVLSLKDMPGADFLTEGSQNGFTANDAVLNVTEGNGYTVTVNSGSVFGIMKADEAMKAANAQRGKMKIYANAYLEIDADGDGETEFYMAENNKDVAWSLYDVMKEINNNWDSFTAAQTKVKDFYTFWAQYGMDAWAAELPKIAG